MRSKRDPLQMTDLPGGTCRIGSDPGQDPDASGDEHPSVEVRIAPFSMSRDLVTRSLYRRIIDRVPEDWGGAWRGRNLPANQISWDDATGFCNRLSMSAGLTPCYRYTTGVWECDWSADGYRLPTEAEWEYACRAGTQTPWYWGADGAAAERHAWARHNTEGPRPVGGKPANPWGLRDMAGNLWEWCWDWYDHYDPAAADNPRGPAEGRGRVIRGGSFANVAPNLRCAERGRREPGTRSAIIGFRCARNRPG